MSKLMMLVAAKWREFSTTNPHLQQDSSVESDYTPTPKASRSRSSGTGAVSAGQEDEDDEQDDEDERSDEKGKKSKRGRKKVASSGKKSGGKVPTLKIKLGKRKRGSSVSPKLRKKQQGYNSISVLQILFFFR